MQLPSRTRIEAHVYSVLDNDGVAHDVVPYPIDGYEYARTVCAAWKQLRIHSQMAKMKHAKLQPVTCLLCLSGEDAVDMPQF